MDSLNTEWILKQVNGEYLWVIEVFFIVVMTLLVALIANRFVNRLSVRAERLNSPWESAFFFAARLPIQWLVWIVGLSYAAEITAGRAEVSLVSVVPGLRHVSTIVVITWFLVNFVSRMEKLYIDPDTGTSIDPTTAMALGKLIRISILITGVLVGMQSLGYSISGVLAFGGVGGIAVGFAAKDLLANFFGGLMVYLDRPFVVGDWIKSPDKEIEGTVEEIGWRLTRIRTFDKRPLYVPNATFTQISVENPSRMTNRRIYETIGVRYSDANKVSEIIAAVRKMIESHPDIDSSQTVIVNFNKFAPSSLDFFVYCFTKTTNWIEFHNVKQDVLLKIINLIEGLGAQCAFPTSTIHVANSVQVEELKR